MNELVSIVTPMYNSEKYISETIISVLKQSYKNWEMLIVDDKSKDNSVNIVKDFSKRDERIVLIELDKNSGAAVARNVALDNAKGRFIAFLDSDDLWEVEKLEKQIDFMKKSNIAFSFTSYKLIDENGNYLNKIVKVPSNIDYKGLLRNTIIGCLTVLIDKKIIGDFRMPLIRRGQDFATWLSILKKGHLAYGLNEPLAKYRFVKESLSSNKIKAAKRTWNIYRDIENLSRLQSSYYFSNYAYNAIKKRL